MTCICATAWTQHRLQHQVLVNADKYNTQCNRGNQRGEYRSATSIRPIWGCGIKTSRHLFIKIQQNIDSKPIILIAVNINHFILIESVINFIEVKHDTCGQYLCRIWNYFSFWLPLPVANTRQLARIYVSPAAVSLRHSRDKDKHLNVFHSSNEATLDLCSVSGIVVRPQISSNTSRWTTVKRMTTGSGGD